MKGFWSYSGKATLFHRLPLTDWNLKYFKENNSSIDEHKSKWAKIPPLSLKKDTVFLQIKNKTSIVWHIVNLMEILLYGFFYLYYMKTRIALNKALSVKTI